MNKLIKSLTLAALFIAPTLHAATLATNVTTAGVYILTTNRISATQVELTSSIGGLVEFFDANSVAAPYYGTNYVTAAYPYRSTYSTNYVTSYVGANGYTNWYTNAGLWTVTLTNAAATNALPSVGAFTVAGNTYAVYDVSILTARGLAMRVATNMSVVVNYNIQN